LLDLSRIEAGQYAMAPSAVPLQPVAARAMESVGAAARAKSIDFTCDIDPALQAHADEGALEQVLVNLLDNAVKYTQPNGHVRIAARPSGSHVRIEVQDDGPGIEARHRARIFERFYRVDTGRSREIGGTGLGLSIVRHLVESMDGEVGVDAGEPRGSVFWLTLPGPR
jgi:two-component system phosphate regulon sensor histidine kinase PhoR